MKKNKIGLIGLGGIMESVHIPGYINDPTSEITAICDINPDRLKYIGDMLNIPDSCRYTDYNDMIDSSDIDAVDIATWNSVHCEIAEKAALSGIHYSVEKPVGMNYAEVKELADVTENTGVKSFVCLSWRYHPYTRFIKYLVTSGKLGNLHHIFVRCIKNSGLWEGRRRDWRFDKARAGSGVLGDLGAHMIDVIRLWGEEFVDVYAQTGIIIKQRMNENADVIEDVDTDDWCSIMATLESGVNCTIQLTRCATTVPNLIEFEIYGDKGKLHYQYPDGNPEITLTDAVTGKEEVVEPPDVFHTLQSLEYTGMLNGTTDEYVAKIDHGLKCQAVIDAALLSSVEHRTVSIDEITRGHDK